ncbi:MAG: thiamine phosphate synthase [Hyphomicrobiales bacterium]
MAKSSPEPEIYRTRVFLITPADYEPDSFAPLLDTVLSAGDVASLLILPPTSGNYQLAAEHLVPIAQKHDVAVLLHNDSQLMGRTNADGLHLDGSLDEIVATVKAHAGRNIMGVANIKNRHEAMVLGEGPVDYLFFGRLDGDNGPDIFPKAFKLAEWWATVMSVPAVVMGGNALDSVTQAGNAGIDFLALRDIIWKSSTPSKTLSEVDKLLDQAFENRKSQYGS